MKTSLKPDQFDEQRSQNDAAKVLNDAEKRGSCTDPNSKDFIPGISNASDEYLRRLGQEFMGHPINNPFLNAVSELVDDVAWFMATHIASRRQRRRAYQAARRISRLGKDMDAVPDNASSHSSSTHSTPPRD